MRQVAVEFCQLSITLLLYSRWIYRLRCALRRWIPAQCRRDAWTYSTLITKYVFQHESLETLNFTFKILLIIIKHINKYCNLEILLIRTNQNLHRIAFFI